MASSVPAWLEEEFCQLNTQHFSGGLPRVLFLSGHFGGHFAIYMPKVRIIQFDPRSLEQSRKWISDTLLHEMVHHHLAEATAIGDGVGDPDIGHGSRFCTIANRIGATLALPTVAPGDGLVEAWPQSVRPPDYAPWQGRGQ